MSRIATRRTVTSVVSRNNDTKTHARVPLSRISNNHRIAKQPSLTRVRQAAAPVVREEPEPRIQVKPFKFVPLQIGEIDYQMEVVEYENLIYRSMRTKESAMPPARFEQSEITLKDRNIMVDMIDKTCFKLGMSTNTFYRFVGIFDRILSIENVPASKLKLFAYACFWIASKIEDIYPAQSTDLIQLSVNSFTQRELFAAEIRIINKINFDTTFATPLFYYTHFMRIWGYVRQETLLLGRYILEIIQTHSDFYGKPPSLMASVAVMVTRILKGEERWPKNLRGYTMYTKEELGPYANIVHSILTQNNREEISFMRRKYSQEIFRNVSHVRVPTSF